MIALFFIIGLLYGSFFNVVACRLTSGGSLVKPRSFCPNCKTPLKNYDLIPVFSYIFLKGCCRSCKTKISPFYPLVELLTAFLFSYSYYKFGMSQNLLKALLLVSSFTIVLRTDFENYIIPDEVVIFFSISNIILLLFEGKESFLIGLLGGVVGFLFFYLIYKVGLIIFKKEVLGGGDIKMMFYLGTVVKANNLFLLLFIASLLAYPVAIFYKFHHHEKMIPFGPFLILSAILISFYNLDILSLLIF